MNLVIDRSWTTVATLVGTVVGILFTFIHAIVAKWAVPIVFSAFYIAVFGLQSAVFFRKQAPGRKLVKVASSITTITTAWAVLLALYSFKASEKAPALLGFGSIGYVVAQFIMLYRLATLDIGKYKVLSSFSHSTVNLVGFTHLGCLFLGFVQAIVDAVTTTGKFSGWVGPVSTIFATLLGAASTSLLLYALHMQRHGLLKLSRAGIMVTLIDTLLVGVFTPTLFLSAMTQAALLVVSRNIGQQQSEDVNQPSFWQRAMADRLHAANFIICMAGLFLFLLPYEPDFASFFDANSDTDVETLDDLLRTLAPSFALIGESWIMTYVAVAMTFLAVGQDRHDVLLIARSFTTVAAGTSPIFALFTIRANYHHLSNAAVVFKGMGVLLLWGSSWALIFLSRRDSMPQARQSRVLLGSGDDAEMYDEQGGDKEHRLMGDETPPLQAEPGYSEGRPSYNPDYVSPAAGAHDDNNHSGIVKQESIVMEEVDMDSADLGSVSLNEPED